MRPSLVDRARIWVARQFFPAQYRQALTSRNSQAYAAISGLYQNADQLGTTLRGQRISKLVRSYGELVWVYVCVTKNAQSIAGVP